MFHISIIQADLKWENPADNRALFSEAFDQINNCSKLIVLPEMFSTGFTMHPSAIAETMEGETVCWMKSEAKKLGKTIAGSIVIREGDSFYNRLIVVPPSQKVKYYDKKHLFRYANEHVNYTSGRDGLIVDVDGVKIAFFVCYDLRFPVWSRNTDLKYDVAVYVANWPKKRRDHWLTLLKARAIENQSFVVGVNRSGIDGNKVEYSGDSVIYDYAGGTLLQSKDEQVTVRNVPLNIENLALYREKFPVYLDADYFELK